MLSQFFIAFALAVAIVCAFYIITAVCFCYYCHLPPLLLLLLGS